MIHFAYDCINDFKRFTLIKKIKFFILSIFFLLAFFVSLKIYVFATRNIHNIKSETFSVKGQYSISNNSNYYEDSITYSGCKINIQVTTDKNRMKNDGCNGMSNFGPSVAYVSDGNTVLGKSVSTNGNNLDPTRIIQNLNLNAGLYLVSYFLHLDWSDGDDDIAYGYKTFTVKPLSMSGTLDFNNLTYNGTKRTIEIPKQQVTGLSGDVLTPVKDKDFTVKYEYKKNENDNFFEIDEDDLRNAGIYRVTLNFKENYSGTKIGTFTINKKFVSDGPNNDIRLSKKIVEYSGSRQEPSIESVTIDGVTATSDDYTVDYGGYDLTSVGHHVGTLTFENNFDGVATFGYDITKKNASNAVVSFTENGPGTEPSYTVSCDGITLQPNDDFDAEWFGDENLSTPADFSVDGDKFLKLNFKGNYKNGEEDSSPPIVRKYNKDNLNANDAEVTLDMDNLTYDGQEHKPSIQSVNLNGEQLTSDYYTYSWNTEDFISAGKKTLNVIFTNGYQGSKSVDFEIYPKDASSADVDLSQDSFIYDETVKKASVESIKLGELVLDTSDYTFSFPDTDYVNAGKKTMIINYKRNFKGQKILEYEIKPNDHEATIILDQSSVLYDGNTHYPEISVSVDGKELPTSNYTVTWDDYDFISAGTKNLTVSLNGNYLGSKSTSYAITQKQISSDSDVEVTLSQNEFSYNSKEQKPSIESVKLGDLILTKEKDYDIVWENPDKNDDGDSDYSSSGKKKFKLEFKGNFSGSKTVEYEIKNLDVSSCTVNLSQDEFAYNSKEQKPSVESVTYGDLTLTENDYDISWTSDNYTSPGDKSLTLNFKGNYAGEKTVGFKILSKNASDANVELFQNSFIYNSQEQKPFVSSVQVDDDVLINARDYTVQWNDEDYSNAGKKSLTLKFKGNYSGEKTIDFKIVPKDASLSVIELSQTDFIFNGEEQRPTVSRVILGDLLLSDEDYDIFWDDGDYINSGDKSLTLKFKGNYSGERTTSFKISPMDSSSVEVELSQDSFTYNSDEQKPLVTSVRIGDSLLTNEKDYDILWDEEDYTNVGYKTLTLKFKGNYSGEKILHYTINNGTDNSSNKDVPTDKTNNEKTENPDTTKNIDNTNNKVDYSPNNVVVDWRSTWGVPVDKFGITHYLLDGETSVEVTDYGKVWLYEESAGTGAWYCLDNSDGVFKIGSKFTVEWLKKSENPEKYEKELSKLDGYRKKRIDEDKAELFLTYVTDPDGHRYTNFGKDSAGTDISVKFYVQIGDDWDKDDIRALYLSSSEDEIVEAYFTNFESPEGKNEDFACLNLKHFSTYLVYDEEILNSEVPDESEQKEEYNSPDSRILNSTGTIVNTSSSENLLKLCIFIVMLLGSTFQIFKFKIRKKVEL